ncbi:MAG: 4Fe-4S dicluster domain-containing protein [Candidatus Aminicenantes bacterium]|nr:4Fe-4S dicluster domain-containing protein [Candidatus Aminicenantes bacterium]
MIYKKLARHLDDLPGGFPETKSGVELRILRRMFTPEQARLALKLTLIPEQTDVIAKRAKIPVKKASDLLEQMAKKGLIYRLKRKGQPARFMAVQFVIGIWELHVNDLDPDLIRDFNEYAPTLFDFDEWKKAPQLRTIPVEQSIRADLEVLPYEDAAKLIQSRSKFLEAPCICRKERRIMGEGCGKTEGNCLIMGVGVEIYKNVGIGKEISQKQALELIKKADKEGLVLQASFSKKIANICCCCGCCCQVLKSFKKHAMPSSLVASAFVAQWDPDACTGCGECVDRCQMDAIRMDDGIAVLDADKCIGCGLCVSSCSSQALFLKRKPGPESPKIPEKLTHAAVKRLRVRGKLGRGKVSSLLLRSQKARPFSKGKRA